MAIDKLKVMLSFMREVNDGNIPNASEYGIENWEYWDIVEACQDEGLIKGANFTKGGKSHQILIGFLEGTKLTVKGMEYLHNNSASMKTYKGLKEIREWLPF
ncbi:MAG: hypothetical protein EOM28_06235 [Clostridia bacterium]|nr:hypothetical protein [Clostridia bacterium]